MQLILTLLLCLTVYDENAAVWKLLINISYKFCQSQHFPQTTAHSATVQQQHNNNTNLHLEHLTIETSCLSWHRFFRKNIKTLVLLWT